MYFSIFLVILTVFGWSGAGRRQALFFYFQFYYSAVRWRGAVHDWFIAASGGIFKLGI